MGLNGYFSDDFLCVRQAVNTFIYRVMVKYLVRTSKHEVFELVGPRGWGTQARCRYSAVSLITRLDFMAPVTRVITALQCTIKPDRCNIYTLNFQMFHNEPKSNKGTKHMNNSSI